jgi:hypothetical protein
MNELVNIMVWPPTFATIITTQVFGGMNYQITINTDIIDAVEWIKDYQLKLQKEIMLRSTNQNLQDSYNEYQTMLKLVS